MSLHPYRAPPHVGQFFFSEEDGVFLDLSEVVEVWYREDSDKPWAAYLRGHNGVTSWPAALGEQIFTALRSYRGAS